MANTKSARKATRKIARRTEINKSRRSKVRGAVRDVENAVAAGNKQAAIDALRAVEPELRRAATRGIMHGKTASRKMSRLAHQVAKLSK